MEERRKYNVDLEIKYNDMCKDITHIKGDIHEIKGYIKEDRIWKKEFGADCEIRRANLDKKYASKETEHTVKQITSGIMGGVLTIITGTTVAIIVFLINK